MNENLNALKRRIAEVEARKPGRMEWLPMETLIRDILNAALSKYISHADALALISDGLGAYTGRGYVLPEDFADSHNRQPLDPVAAIQRTYPQARTADAYTRQVALDMR